MTMAVQRITLHPGAQDDDAIAAVVACLRSGGLAVAPTDTTYGLLADAENLQAFGRVFAAKDRALDQPVPYLLADLAQTEAFLASALPLEVKRAAEAYWPGPLTLVVAATEAVAVHLTDVRGTVALRVPDHAFIRAVAEGVGGPLTGTSANRSGLPAATTAAEAERQLGGLVDCIADGGVADRPASTVIDTTGTPWRMLRTGAISGAAVEERCGVPVQEE